MTVDINKRYSLNGQIPVYLPHKLRLSDGSTITDRETYTQEQIADAGYIIEPDMPSHNSDQYLEWSTDKWIVKDYSQDQTNIQWEEIRLRRNQFLAEADWRVTRNLSETRQGLSNTDDLDELDTYMEELRQIPQKQTNPWDITWPETTNIKHDSSDIA